jgi:quercetin dioxygenase-like cupin family protein
MNFIPFQIIDWDKVPTTEKNGETGTVRSKTLQFDNIRVRIVEYSAGYRADHWCQKGHIIHCLDGEMVSELEDGTKSVFSKGMTYIVSDDLSSHRSTTANGVKLLIIDGDFLKSN